MAGKNRVGRPSRRDQMSEAVLTAMRADRMSGMGFEDLARKYEVSLATVKRWLTPDPLNERLSELPEHVHIDLGADPELLLRDNGVILSSKIGSMGRIAASPRDVAHLASAHKAVAATSRTAPPLVDGRVIEDDDVIDAEIPEDLRGILNRIAGNA